MKAEPVYVHKRIYPNGDIAEINVWKVARSTDKPHGFKYSLAYIRKGKRVIGYDNAERKGDHRHYKDKEYAYTFKDVDKLFEDFYKDIRRFRNEGQKHKT
ncbi:MAG: DUF6516 family protein [Candidatus Scalindua sp.]